MTGDFGGAAKKLLVNELKMIIYPGLLLHAECWLSWYSMPSHISAPALHVVPGRLIHLSVVVPDPAKSCPIREDLTRMSPVLMIQWSCLSLVRARAEMTRLRHRNPVNGQYHIPTPTGWLTPMRCNKRNL